ncbi:tubulin-specific chaperone E [Salarias fasciatus]|nr:tubulin-specific chaperone E [Salarias fasciatus]
MTAALAELHTPSVGFSPQLASMAGRPEPEPEPEVPGDAVGRRVSCGGERATVRYVGPVPPTAGVWLGVEWDDPQRGRHDGSHEGVRYFSCRHPRGGSFIRPAKASFGVDYLTALQQFYHYDVEEVDSILSFYTKDRSLDNLSSVLLVDSEVNGPGPDGAARRTTPNVQLLDLSGSLLPSWEEAARLGLQLEQLEQLRLSRTRLAPPPDPPSLSHAFSNLKLLHLIRCELTWPQVLHCAPMWPRLERLSVAENNIVELQRPRGVLEGLVSLSLELNPLEQDALLQLSALPSLQDLNVSQTGLSAVRFQDAAPGHRTDMFPQLKTLLVDDNNISQWSVIDELAKLPRLEQLSCRRNPLQSGDRNPATAEQMVLAKLGRLQVLNGRQVLPEERGGAERDYLKMFGREWLQSEGCQESRARFSQEHPRYQVLVSKYGAAEESEMKKVVSVPLKNQLLKITFLFPDDPDRRPVQKKLPGSMEVQKVKGLLHRLLKVPSADLRLTYCTPKKEGTEFQLDGDLKPLKFYAMEDGDQVLVRWS